MFNGGFRPVLVHGLVLWLRADMGVTQAGGFVSNWADQSGHGNDASQATGANQPTFDNYVINGRPGVRFTGNTVSLTSGTNLLPGGSARHIIAVIKCGSSAAPGGPIIVFRQTAPWFAAYLYTLGAATYAYSDAVSVTTAYTSPPTIASTAFEWEVASAGTGTANLTTSLNGTLEAAPTGNVATESGNAGFVIGNAPNVSQFFDGDICELLVYDHVLAANELIAVRGYLFSRYGFAGPPAPGLKLWLRADLGIYTTSSNITEWADQSGNGNHYVQGAGGQQPTVTANAINGLPAVTFDGVVQFLTSSFLFSGAKTVILVRRLVSLPGASAIFGPYSFKDSAGNFSEALIINTAGYQPYSLAHDFAGLTTSVGDATALDTSWHIAIDTYDGGNNTSPASYVVELDSVPQALVASGVFNRTTTDVGASLGAFSSAGNVGQFYAPIQIAEVIVYDHVLAPDEVVAVQGYLNARYGVLGFGRATITGLKLWLRADAGVTLSGSGVSNWADQSGNGNDVSQATGAYQPTVTPASINGLPGINFSATQGLTGATTLLASGSPRTVIAVIKPTSTTDCLMQIFVGGTAWLARLFTNAGNKEFYNSVSGGTADTITLGFDPSNTGHVLEISSVVGSKPTVAFDGASYLATASAGDGTVKAETGGTSSFFNVGCYVPSANGFAGDICEMLVFDHVLGASDLNQVRVYLQGKYGISLGV
jgi:hypothetical protein